MQDKKNIFECSPTGNTSHEGTLSNQSPAKMQSCDLTQSKFILFQKFFWKFQQFLPHNSKSHYTAVKEEQIACIKSQLHKFFSVLQKIYSNSELIDSLYKFVVKFWE